MKKQKYVRVLMRCFVAILVAGFVLGGVQMPFVEASPAGITEIKHGGPPRGGPHHGGPRHGGPNHGGFRHGGPPRGHRPPPPPPPPRPWPGPWHGRYPHFWFGPPPPPVVVPPPVIYIY